MKRCSHLCNLKHHTSILMSSFNPFLNQPMLYLYEVQIFRKHWKKKKLHTMSNFSLSNNVFYPSRKHYHFNQIQNCCLQTLSVWKSHKLNNYKYDILKGPFSTLLITFNQLPAIQWVSATLS